MDGMTGQIPWSTTLSELRELEKESAESACCVFGVAEDIPGHARRGYATLVMAYARESEPVAVLEDGSAALLVVDGGVAGARAVAQRILSQLAKLGLQDTVRIGIDAHAPGHDTVDRARAAATKADLGGLRVEE
jgi:hypothetical protein